jgi:RND family efflux transporter MFP subunit
MRRKAATSILILAVGFTLFSIFQKPEEGIGTSRPEEADREVRAFRVTPRILPEALSGAGILAGWRELDVVAEVSGRVVAPPVEVGMDVAEGATLARLDTTSLEIELRSREAQVRKAELALRGARRDEGRVAPLRNEGVVSESDWNRIDDAVGQAEAELGAAEAARDATRKALADTGVRAPFAGRVVRRHAELGAFVAVGSPIARLVDLSRLRLRVGVSPRMAVAVRPGVEASLVVDAYPGERFDGRVHSVAAEADTNGLFPIEIVTASRADKPLLPGMVARVHVVAGEREPRLLVPPSAIARRDGRDIVFVVSGEADRVRLRVVSLGTRNGHAVELTAGVEAGELVAYEGHSGLEDGDAVRVLGGDPVLQPGFAEVEDASGADI